jgi:hypothetical protein
MNDAVTNMQDSLRIKKSATPNSAFQGSQMPVCALRHKTGNRAHTFKKGGVYYGIKKPGAKITPGREDIIKVN